MSTRVPNPEQAAAIAARGEVFVSAGAGTGKTTVLVERFAEAVCERGLDVESLLVITYTERAAGELRARIRARLVDLGRSDLARRLDGAWISTIHGFCLRVLKAHPFAAELDPRFRVLDESQGRVLRGEAFEAALAEFCAGGRPEGLRLLATYGAAGLRRMLTGVYETLRSAGRDLDLELGERPGVGERLAELREAAECLARDEDATELQRAAAAAALELDSSPDALVDLRPLRASGERAATYEEARKALESAALDELAARDRELLQELLRGFAAAYAEAKDRESALDFEDLQLRARDLLRDRPEIREREALRFRSIMVDEFQDTNRLQCDLIDLLSRPWPAPPGRTPAPSSPDAAAGTSLSRPVLGAVPSGAAPGAAPQERESPDPLREVFVVGDEFQSIYGFRHADVGVFRERRDAAANPLALTMNYRSRPEVLAVVNHLFGPDFGSGFQPLAASREFPDPVFGTPVELLVTDKPSYADTGTHWRRAEARHIARRVRELVDTGAAEPGEIVLLFAAGTDAEWYEEELRAGGLPTYRATGKGYFGQQQVVDLLAYLRLLHNRYDDEALLTVLASPFVGVSNDALVLTRRAASKRPIFAGLERQPPPGLSAEDERLVRAFKQRYDRLATAASRLSLERLCERIVVDHDYDLAVLAQWDGRRRYANLRKLARLARSYEELRGPDVEGFVRFVREQEAVGSPEREAVAEEEGAGAVRLLTIHAAKGLEFKVVVVADAGRDRSPPAPDEILCLSDGRFGFRVAHPVSGERKGTGDWEAVREARRAEEDAERLRLYYVAMTRAQERLIVSGAVDPAKEADARTPIGWVLGRLQLAQELPEGDGPVEVERQGARLLLKVDRGTSAHADEPRETEHHEPGQLALFERIEDVVLPPAPRLHELVTVPEPPLHRVRRLSYSALALFERCSYRYYAERVAGMRPLDGARGGENGEGDGAPGLHATEIGDAAHRLLELVDLADPRPPSVEIVRSWYPLVAEEELERIRGFVEAYCTSALAQRVASLLGARPEVPFAFEHDGVLLHGRLDVLDVEGPRALVLDYKTNALGDLEPAEVVDEEYRLQRLVYALVCFRAGAKEVEVVYAFLERPDEPVSSMFTRDDVPALEAALSEAIGRIDAGDFVPTPSEFACSGCPALDVVCAGPRLRRTPPRPPALAAAG